VSVAAKDLSEGHLLWRWFQCESKC